MSTFVYTLIYMSSIGLYRTGYMALSKILCISCVPCCNVNGDVSRLQVTVVPGTSSVDFTRAGHGSLKLTSYVYWIKMKRFLATSTIDHSISGLIILLKLTTCKVESSVYVDANVYFLLTLCSFFQGKAYLKHHDCCKANNCIWCQTCLWYLWNG